MDVAEVVIESGGLGWFAVEFSPAFKFGIFFMDVGTGVLFMEEVAEGGEESEEVTFVGVFDVLELDGVCCGGCCGIVAVNESIEVGNEALVSRFADVGVEMIKLQERLHRVAEISWEFVFIDVVL